MSQNSAANTQRKSMTGSDIRFWVVAAVFTALTYVFTAFVNVRLPFGGNGGLIHLGNVPLFLAAILYGKKTGAIAGSIGMGAFDLFSGWTLWAPFTFVIVGLMGYTVGAITEKHQKFGWRVFAMVIALFIKIAGYYVAEGIIYGNWIAPVMSIPGNIIQVVTAAVIVAVIAGRLKVISDRIMG